MTPVTKAQLVAFVRKTYEGLSYVPNKCALDPIAADAFLDALYDDLRRLISRIEAEESEIIDAEFEEVLDFESQDPGHPLLKGLLTQAELDERGLDGSEVCTYSDKRFIEWLRRASAPENNDET